MKIPLNTMHPRPRSLRFRYSIIPFSRLSLTPLFHHFIIPAFHSPVLCFLLLMPVSVLAQDTTRMGIHQQEAELHRWDVMKTHRLVPQLQKGAESARSGDFKGAIRWFQKAAPGRPSLAYFNLGVLYFETQQFDKALRYFKLSYRARKDTVCLDYLGNTERLISERQRR
jgi:hypothetical protein